MASTFTTPSETSSSTPTTTWISPSRRSTRRDRTTGDEDTITDAHGSGISPGRFRRWDKLVYGTRLDNQTGLRIRDLASGEERWLKLPSPARRTRVAVHARPDSRLRVHARWQIVLAAYGGKIHRLDVQTERRDA